MHKTLKAFLEGTHEDAADQIGIDRILLGTSALLEEGGRFNLTLRRVTPA